MSGLFGTLNMGARSLQAEQTAVQIAGQNLANVNNPAYARQRVQMQTSVTIQTPSGEQGTGVQVTGIQQIRDALLDSQVTSETSVGGYWNSQQSGLQSVQIGLGEYIDSTSGSASSTDGTTSGIADDLSGLFNAFQSVATSPESLTNRQFLINSAQTLATKLNQTSASLTNVKSQLNASLDGNVKDANQLITDIANLNKSISLAQSSGASQPNDLIDLRQSKMESLANLVNFTASNGNNGAVNIAIGGNQIVSDSTVVDTLATFDAGGGQMMVRTVAGNTALTLQGGEMQGTIDARDGALATMQNSLDTLASQLITQVNAIHGTGYGTSSSTANFFNGSNAANISVNPALVSDASQVRVGATSAPGDNSVAVALGQLANTPQSGLGNQTFNQAYNQSVASLGYSLSNANTQVNDTGKVQAMLGQQRASVSGVSVDEEMTNLIGFQKAYEASAKLVTTVDQMLETIIGMKQ